MVKKLVVFLMIAALFLCVSGVMADDSGGDSGSSDREQLAAVIMAAATAVMMTAAITEAIRVRISQVRTAPLIPRIPRPITLPAPA